MAKKFTVTTSELTRKKEELLAKNSELSNKISRLQEVEAQLNQQWDGDANDKFHNAFNKDKSKMDEFHKAIGEYCKQLGNIIKKYEEVEKQNLGLIK